MEKYTFSGKTEEEALENALSELNVSKEDCLIVEDSIIGVEAANNAGIDCITIYDRFSDSNRDKINELSIKQFDDFSQILELIKNEVNI